jgi:fructose-1,6-bisphosphatase/inositol monophosphatase family enzyme
MLKLPKKENGGGSIWDFAATACIYQELGLPATNFEGGRLDLNRKDSTFMNKEGVFYANLIYR